MRTETVKWLTLRREAGIMRSFKRRKASILLTWLRNRAAASKAPLPQTVEEFRQAGIDATSNSGLGLLNGGSIFGQSCLKARDWPTRGVATFSAGGSGRAPGKRKDPTFLLGAGWEGGGEDVAVAVWWDFENCNVPLGIEVYKVGVNIVSGLRMYGFKGPVSISAYGDTLQLSRSAQEALASTGIRLHHIPSGGKDSSDRALLVDLILWTLDHPPPVHLFLVSGDRDFSNALHRLRMMNYNILLACPAGATVSPALLGAATQVWQWNSLVRGEGLLSVNPSSDSRPPDGSSGGGSTSRPTTQKPNSSSLYPGLRAPDGNGPSVDTGGKSYPLPVSPLPMLSPEAIQEHPIPPDGAASPDGASMSRPIAAVQGLKATEDQRESPQEVKVSRSTSDSLLREVPKEVLQQFHNLLVSHPNGIMLADLQKCVLRDKVSFEKDFYGHGKIVPFLFSIPHVVRLERVLMKDNRSWSYLLTSTAKSAQTKQEGTSATSDSTNLTKVTMEQEARTTFKHAQKSPVTSSLAVAEATQIASNCSVKGNQEKANLPEVFEIGSSSPEQPTETSIDDRQISDPESVEEAQSKDSERSTREVIHLNEESSPPCLPSETLVQVEKLEQSSSRGLHSFWSSLKSTFRGW